jgi:hypothetical protein
MCFTGLPLTAANQERVSWRELPAFTKEQTISLELTDGVKLRGKILGVEADKLSFDVSKTSSKQLYPKGKASIARSSVRSFQMNRTGSKWKVIATAIGLGAGLAVAMPVNTYAHNEGDGAPLAVAAIIIVPPVLGFLAGRSADKKTITVTVTD